MNGGEIAVDVLALAGYAVLSAFLMFDWRPWRRIPHPSWHRRARILPTHRPLEELAARARSLGPRVRQPAPGLRFTKFEGLRRGYDDVLGEMCDEVEIAHLLAVLPPGEEHDRERKRVESALTRAGIDLVLP